MLFVPQRRCSLVRWTVLALCWPFAFYGERLADEGVFVDTLTADTKSFVLSLNYCFVLLEGINWTYVEYKGREGTDVTRS